MVNQFIFRGRMSREFGIYISGPAVYNAPERDVEEVEIPGRNGTLTIDNGRYKNISVNYPAFIRKDFARNAGAARKWLLHGSGYERLEDSYDPNFFRLGKFTGPIDFDMRFLNLSGEMDLTFNCAPQRFYKPGQYPEVLTASRRILNPFNFPSRPLIRVYGTSGTLTINNDRIEISEIDGYVDIDCDRQNAYKGEENKNATVSHTFSELPGGINTVELSTGITRVEITPRWWCI